MIRKGRNDLTMITEELQKEISSSEFMALALLSRGYKIEHPGKSYIDPKPLPAIEKGSTIAANIFLIKMPAYGININTPDWLIYLIDLCAGGSPGFIQLIYKELLVFINNSKFKGNGIPKGYTITTADFASCFAVEFPITLNPRIYEKYSKQWDEQKIERSTPISSDNACDSAEYWTSVMA